MIGIVIVTHGRLAAEFIAALEHVVGPQRDIAAICIGPDDDMEQRRQDILQSVRAVDTGDGVVLLTDMFGGTPSNLAISVMDRPKIEVIAGDDGEVFAHVEHMILSIGAPFVPIKHDGVIYIRPPLS